MEDSKLQKLYSAIDQLVALELPISAEQRMAVHNEERRYINEELVPFIEEEVKELADELRCSFKLVIEADEEGNIHARQVYETSRTEDGRIGERKKKFILRVLFPDGSVICQQKVSETLAEVVRRIGVDRVRNLNLQVLGHDLISDELHPNARYRSGQLPVGENLYVMTYCDSEAKLRIIKEMSAQLNLGLKVEKVML